MKEKPKDMNHFLLSTISPEKLIEKLNKAYYVQSQINMKSRWKGGETNVPFGNRVPKFMKYSHEVDYTPGPGQYKKPDPNEKWVKDTHNVYYGDQIKTAKEKLNPSYGINN